MAEDIARGNEELIAERLLSAIKEPFDLGDNFVQVSASIGIATYPACGTKACGLVAAADAAMYFANAAHDFGTGFSSLCYLQRLPIDT